LIRVKICGITDVYHAQAAIEAGADFIGVVFAPSPRQVTYEKAREIVAAVKTQKHDFSVVGVFANMSVATVNAAASFCGLDCVQLSGNETWQYCQQIEKPMIKAIHISHNWRGEELLLHLENYHRVLGSKSPIYLLDTFAEHQYGGTGKTFAWEIASHAAAKFPLVIAGGLHPGNVSQVIASLRPWGVDVSSGVETNGVKSVRKIRAFVRAVRSTQQYLLV